MSPMEVVESMHILAILLSAGAKIHLVSS